MCIDGTERTLTAKEHEAEDAEGAQREREAPLVPSEMDSEKEVSFLSSVLPPGRAFGDAAAGKEIVGCC